MESEVLDAEGSGLVFTRFAFQFEKKQQAPGTLALACHTAVVESYTCSPPFQQLLAMLFLV